MRCTAAAVAAPCILPSSVFGANGKLNIAWVGLGGRGWGDVRGVGEENIVALCDADLGARPLQEAIARWPEAKVYQDFRVMLDEMGPQIDAVGISTTDHAHFPAAYKAITMGKHVFIQKPLTHTLWEARTLRRLAAAKGVVTQMGNQGHASEGIRLIKEWVQAGLIGDVTEVIAWTDRPAGGYGFRGGSQQAYPEAQPVPEGLDWALWRGPVSEDIAYNPAFHPLFWRGWWAFGAGGLGDIGCHTLDAPFWSLELAAPRRVDVRVGEVNPIYTALGAVVTYHFDGPGGKPPVKMTWYEGPTRPELPEGYDFPADPPRGGGMVMIGSEGAIGHDGMRPDSPRLYPDAKWEAFRADPSLRPERTLPRVRGGILSDWISGIKGGAAPCSNFEVSAPLTEMILLGTLAIRTGKPVEFDPETMRIPNNPEADGMIRSAVRKGWDVESLT